MVVQVPNFDFEQLFRNTPPPTKEERCERCEQYHFLCECEPDHD